MIPDSKGFADSDVGKGRLVMSLGSIQQPIGCPTTPMPVFADLFSVCSEPDQYQTLANFLVLNDT